MFGIPSSYLINRLVTLLLTVWIAATLIWIIPRLSPVDPAEVMLGRMAAGGAFVEGSEEILAQLQERFGLNDAWYVQYGKYMWSIITFDFGVSVASFPTPVWTLVAQALPWTLGLMILSLILTFIIGNALGAFMVWERTPKPWKVVIPSLMIFTSIPPILSGLLLMYIFSVKLRWFPLTGSYGLTVTPGWN
ncbi:MAG: ABC transporter permease, partial [Pseudomonadota bacterium]